MKKQIEIHEPANCEEYARIEKANKKTEKNKFWKCHECGMVGYTNGIKSHACARKNMKGSQPDCSKCYDKGFFTELVARTQYKDFVGDAPTESTMVLVVHFCICIKGQRAKKKGIEFELPGYNLPRDYATIRNIKVNGTNYGRFTKHSACFGGDCQDTCGSEAKRGPRVHKKVKETLS